MTKNFTIETYQSLGDKPLTREDCIKHKIHYRNGEVPDYVYFSYYSEGRSSWPLRSVHPNGMVINNTLPDRGYVLDLLIDVEDEIVETEIGVFSDGQILAEDDRLFKCNIPLYALRAKLTINLTARTIKSETLC